MGEDSVLDILLQKANKLPLSPGVYIMRDKNNKVIYVGKSRKLKNRVSQYFQNSAKNIKTAKMVSLVRDFDYYICDTEIEALSLENTLIKQYTPKYNIRLKDAKSYPYIKVTAEEYPRLMYTRKRSADKAKYFGPYTGTANVFAILHLLQNTLGLPSCKLKFPSDIGKERPCLYYQMKRCCGVCTGQVSAEEYNSLVRCAVDILRGNTAEAKSKLNSQMLEYAENEQFEAAARCRDTIAALDALDQKQKVVASPDAEHDVIAFYSDDVCSCISVFYVRGGALVDKSEFLFGADQIVDENNISSFICEHYKIREYIPSKILLAFDMDEGERNSLGEYISKIAERHVTLKTPERGELRTLCELTKSNAENKAALYKLQLQKEDENLLKLAEVLHLEVLPERIEAYDISNLGSEHITAGMIVCESGKLKRADYRLFSIRNVEGTDDYASMCEALERRIDHLDDDSGSFSNYPDLILLDGGKGHVSTVRDMLRRRGIEIPVFGMVKDDYHKTRALCSDAEEISIAKEQQLFIFLYKLQEEVHRFTVSGMENAKRKTLRTSSLEKIRGIGPKKAKNILGHFGGIGKLKEADVAGIMKVKGISEKDAEEIYHYFHKESKDQKQ